MPAFDECVARRARLERSQPLSLYELHGRFLYIHLRRPPRVRRRAAAPRSVLMLIVSRDTPKRTVHRLCKTGSSGTRRCNALSLVNWSLTSVQNESRPPAGRAAAPLMSCVLLNALLNTLTASLGSDVAFTRARLVRSTRITLARYSNVGAPAESAAADARRRTPAKQK
ncbi:hypothetical protein EVAR_35325_1 [Eumeta japonica]|uniref:Uncharacterized protein n=1 Tax=Eumeta variegata TaxID=151549 RepID=A0A4C1XMJ6_EUMVA|nr:hypothetical protein EVAR_35325_1 [Eumeta japonica]